MDSSINKTDSCNGEKKKKQFTHLFSIVIEGCNVAVPLAINGGIPTSPNGVHLPLSKIVVDHMYVPSSAPGHPLHQLLAEVVEGYGNLHARVWQVGVAVAQQHHLVVVREPVVGDGDRSGTHYSIDQAVLAVGEWAVVYP